MLTTLPTPDTIAAGFRHWNLDAGHQAYVRSHARRYAYLLRLVDRLLARTKEQTAQRPIKVLDIGPAYQTELLQNLQPDLRVNTVGFADDHLAYREEEQHFPFDLNDAQFPEKWIALEAHDLITMCEVIEHLYTSPRLVLQCVDRWLEPGGHVVIQTPNAVSLQRRIKMLAGYNPFEMIRDQRYNPGHFREYTLKELARLGSEAGWRVVQSDIRNYFEFDSVYYRGYNLCSPVLPASLRAGITICFQKP